ncbi:MAG: GNAT family N-acetyltransferase [Candidatus Cloacimonas sp.]
MLNLKRIKELDSELYQKITKLWQETGISKPERKDSLESIKNNLHYTGTIIIAEENEDLAGAVWVCHDYRRLYIHHMAVSPSRQNQGIGSKLLYECIAIAKELGLQAKLEVNIDNPAAFHLYQKSGFTELTGYRVLIKRDV